jgi:20S proteasome subunit beta 7
MIYDYKFGFLRVDDVCIDDGFAMSAKSLHCWLTRVLYNKRSEFDPLWTTFVVGGIEAGEEQPLVHKF